MTWENSGVSEYSQALKGRERERERERVREARGTEINKEGQRTETERRQKEKVGILGRLFTNTGLSFMERPFTD